MTMPPKLPGEYHVRFTNTRHGRMRSRTLGRPTGAPPVVTVMGMAVSDYLLPAQAALDWTQAHLLDLPGLAGSADAPHRIDVPGFGDAVVDWLEASGLPPVILAGHSSGTQVAARAAVARPDLVAATVLASPTVDPKARSVPRACTTGAGTPGTRCPGWRRATSRSGAAPVPGRSCTYCARTCATTWRTWCRGCAGPCW
jgi:pimeloyl-ACP methyl ester carboxylesterase